MPMAFVRRRQKRATVGQHASAVRRSIFILPHLQQLVHYSGENIEKGV
jgi:hypothetical protein